ncbi:hypothetical protein [Amphibacillus sediminis]|uniref:hypothetical protein n=1 Tax=Amphibacillus sediminis TaxID=360185 RepID=UPI0008304562|nr:hypothetical protein [Amphibacillus sediminis]
MAKKITEEQVNKIFIQAREESSESLKNEIYDVIEQLENSPSQHDANFFRRMIGATFVSARTHTEKSIIDILKALDLLSEDK